MALPNLIVIGAPKCATTSLHAYLATHPQIFTTRQKELHFFIADQSWSAWNRGLKWYEAQFEEGKNCLIRGESSPGYSVDGFTPEVVARMAPLVPQAKLVYMMRDPIERIRSHYTEELYNGHLGHRPPWITLEHILAAGPNEPGLLGYNYRVLVNTSLYHRQLSLYLEQFSLEQMHFVTMESLKGDLAGEIRKVLGFLGADESILPTNLTHKLNEKANKRLRVVNPTALLRRLPSYSAMSRTSPRLVKQLYRRVISRRMDHESLMRISEESEQKLRALIEPDIAKLRAVTGHKFSEWSL